LWILQAIEIPFTGGQIDPCERLATQKSPLPWGHAKESFHHCAPGIGLSVSAGVTGNELVNSHALGLIKDGIRRISMEPPVAGQQPALHLRDAYITVFPDKE